MNAFTKLYAILSVLEARIEDARDEKGVTAIEYALMAAGIAVIVGAAMTTLGGKIGSLFSGINV